MKKIVIAAGLAAGLTLGLMGLTTPVQAQSLLVTGDDDASSNTESAPDATAAEDTASSPAVSLPSDSNSSASSGSSSPYGSTTSDITPPDVAGGGRAPVQPPQQREPLPKTVNEILSPENLGMTPQEYADELKKVEKEAVLHPDAVMESPLFEIEMLKTGEQLSKAMDKRVRESCDVPAFTLSLDSGGWTPAARDAMKTKAIGTLATAIDSICRDQTKKEELMNSLYALDVKNVMGAGVPKIVYENDNFVLSGDFSKIDDEFSPGILRNQLEEAARKDAARREKLQPQIDEMASKYPDSNKPESGLELTPKAR